MYCRRKVYLNTLFYKDSRVLYDGTQLAPHWAYRKMNILGDVLVAFTGEARVSLEHMVDLEDVKKKAPIYSPLMLHFIGEWFINSFEMGILYQHLFICEAYEALLERKISHLSRRGNDIYFQGNRKLNVSIATKSNTSVLMHAGFNIETLGTPVPTVGLNDFKIEPDIFADEILGRFQRSFEGWKKARVKVSPR